jgi:hypothetical protein
VVINKPGPPAASSLCAGSSVVINDFKGTVEDVEFVGAKTAVFDDEVVKQTCRLCGKSCFFQSEWGLVINQAPNYPFNQQKDEVLNQAVRQATDQNVKVALPKTGVIAACWMCLERAHGGVIYKKRDADGNPTSTSTAKWNLDCDCPDFIFLFVLYIVFCLYFMRNHQTLHTYIIWSLAKCGEGAMRSSCPSLASPTRPSTM